MTVDMPGGQQPPPTKNAAAVARLLLDALDVSSHNQTTLAAAMLRGQSYVSDVLNGRRDMTLGDFYRACSALRLDPKRIIMDAQTKAESDFHGAASPQQAAAVEEERRRGRL